MKAKLTHYDESIKGKIGLQNVRLEMIQMLIPLGLQAVEDSLQQEVLQLAGEKYSRAEKKHYRWGSNPGSVYLLDQKVGITVPRIRDANIDKEVELKNYNALQSPKLFNELVFKKVIKGVSMGNYRDAALELPETFGISKSSVSRKFIKASEKTLQEFLKRNLKNEDIIAIFLDGKSFSKIGIIIALGVKTNGTKIILGYIESGTENKTACKDFLGQLVSRGLSTENEILFIIDGSKGLYRAIEEAFGDKAFIQRCQWHKRENVISYLSEDEAREYKNLLQEAYEKPIYKDAKSSLMEIKNKLEIINQSAARSLAEGLDETLTIHRLGLFSEIGESFKTTNCIENLNSRVEYVLFRICNWKNSSQRNRWLASAFLEIEPKLRKVRGHKNLLKLREAMKTLKLNFIKKSGEGHVK